MPGNPVEYSEGVTTWGYLLPHLEHGNLYFVDLSLQLREVAEALGKDDAARVSGWLKSGELVKLESIHAGQWHPAETFFDAVVVSPFVLCRPVPE